MAVGISRPALEGAATCDSPCSPPDDRPPKPVKITYLIGSLAVGGTEGQLLQLLSKLDPRRWQTSLILFDRLHIHRVPSRVNGVLSLEIPSTPSRLLVKSWRMATAARRLAGYLRRLHPDIVHAFLPAACVLAAPAHKLAGVPLLIGSRRSLVEGYRGSLLVGQADHLATRLCSFMLGNSAAVTEELRTIDGIPPGRAVTIYNGVDTSRFKPGDRSLRQVYGWGEDHVVFGIVANFRPYKRQVDFVRAAALIAAQAQQARFLMVGEDRGSLHEVQGEIARHRLESRFVIIPGTAHPELLYPAMDVYVCSSSTEGFSNVLLEAAACGLPIIATKTGGNAEVIEEGQTGCLVQVGAPEQLAARALELLRNPTLRLAWGEASRRRVEASFSIDRMVRNHEALYQRLLNRGS